MGFYARGPFPSDKEDNFYECMKYIMEVYAVFWFEIKRDMKLHYQPLYIFIMIRKIKIRSEKIQTVVINNLKYIILSENFLYYMRKSDELQVRIISCQENYVNQKWETSRAVVKDHSK